MIKSPYFLFNKQKFIDKVRRYTSLYQLFYPCKVNSTDLVIDTIASTVCSFEVDSIEVIKHLIDNKNISPERILYNYLIRSAEDIEMALQLGVRMFSVDDIQDIADIEKNNTPVKYLLRISIQEFLNDQDSEDFIDKWGVSTSDVKKLINYIEENTQSSVYGVGFYYPQEYNTFERISNTIEKIISTFDCVKKQYHIDIGGGISIDKATLIASRFCDSGISFMIEPGRHLVGDCMDMVCEIVDVREKGNATYMFLNVGIYSGFIDSIIKKHQFEFYVEDSQTSLQEVVVCGCTSDISDVFGIYFLPKERIKKGSQLIIRHCGAYCTEMHMTFSGHSVPKKMELSDGREPPFLPN